MSLSARSRCGTRPPGLAEAGQAFYDKLKSLTLAELLQSGQESSEGKAHV
ncbi:MAG: hypothetical protein WHT07_04675 [Desulfobaccales bacterium]